MRNFIRLGLALGLAFILAGTASATEKQDCARLVIVGDNPDVTTITANTAQVATYVSADQNIRLNDGGGGTWAIGTADEVEWCWTKATGAIESSRDFKITASGSLSTNATTASSWFAIAVDSTTGIAAGDEVGAIPHTHLVLAADVANITTIEYATITSGGCVGLVVDSATSGAAITLSHFTLDVEQLVCER